MKINFDQRISFLEEGTISDGYGGYLPKTIREISTFAHIEQLKQNRSLELVQMRLPTAYRVTIYFRKDFSPKVENLVFWRGTKYRIVNTPTVDDTRLSKFLIFDMAE